MYKSKLTKWLCTILVPVSNDSYFSTASMDRSTVYLSCKNILRRAVSTLALAGDHYLVVFKLIHDLCVGEMSLTQDDISVLSKHVQWTPKKDEKGEIFVLSGVVEVERIYCRVPMLIMVVKCVPFSSIWKQRVKLIVFWKCFFFFQFLKCDSFSASFTKDSHGNLTVKHLRAHM